MSIAARSKVSALLFHIVRDRQKDLSIPDEVYQQLQEKYRMNLFRNTLLLEEFEKLRTAFAAAGIEIIVLKGMFFLHVVYQARIGVRRMEDVDFLVKAANVEKARHLIGSLGYRNFDTREKNAPSGESTAAMFLKHDKDQSVFMPLHLHWGLSNVSMPLLRKQASGVDVEEIWDAGVRIDKNKDNLFMMPPEQMFTALCEHGMRHGFARLNILYDLHAFVLAYRDSLDWQEIAALGRQWGLVLPIYMGVSLIKELFSTPVPEDFLSTLRPQGMSLLEKYFFTYAKNNDFPREDACVLLYLAIQKGFFNKIKAISAGVRWKAAKSF